MDLDFWLRLLERRVLVAIVLVAGALYSVNRWGDYWKTKLDMKLHPPAAALSPLSADIMKDVEKREAARVRALYRGVVADIDKAKAEGFDPAKLEQLRVLADDALARDSAMYREVAMKRLNDLRMQIPVKPTFTKTANAGDRNPDLNDAPEPKTTYKPGKRKGRR